MDSLDWQTPTALIIVALTFAVFVWRTLKKRRSKTSGCGSGCCSASTFKPGSKRPPLN